MKNTIKVLWYVIISAMVLTMFVLVSAKVFAHGDGECLPDAVGIKYEGWVKIIDHLSGDDLEGFVHGHRDQYYDKDGNPTGQATGFFSIDFDDDEGDYFADCPPVGAMEEAGHPNTPILRRLLRYHTNRHADDHSEARLMVAILLHLLLSLNVYANRERPRK